jgi:hypothetical protein
MTDDKGIDTGTRGSRLEEGSKGMTRHDQV